MQVDTAKKIEPVTAAHTVALYSHTLIECEKRDCAQCLDEKRSAMY
jgi:hypothetical protein